MLAQRAIIGAAEHARDLALARVTFQHLDTCGRHPARRSLYHPQVTRRARGDRQLDLEWSFDAALEPGHRLGIWLSASYTLQLGDRLVRRVSPP
ncbi:MAG: hypothetical protein V3T28_06410, partial [Gemmatimonadales bacterium]